MNDVSVLRYAIIKLKSKKYKVQSEYTCIIFEKYVNICGSYGYNPQGKKHNYNKNVQKSHVNSLAHMESACMLREGLMCFMYNISYTRQSLLLHFLRTLKKWSIFVLLFACCVSRCFPMAEQWCSPWCVDVQTVSVGQCTRHNLHRTNHIEISTRRYTTYWVLTIRGLSSLTLRVCDSFLLVKTGFTLTSILVSKEYMSLSKRSADHWSLKGNTM